MHSLRSDNKVKSFNDAKYNENTTVTENELSKRKPGKYQQLFKEFSQESSAGGINKVFSSKPVLIRSIWVILCIVCYGAMIFLSYVAIREYFRKPTSTFIDVSFESDACLSCDDGFCPSCLDQNLVDSWNHRLVIIKNDLPFPAITICNLNKFRAKALSRHLPGVNKVLMDHRRQTFFQGRTKNDWQSPDQQKKFFLKKMRNRSGITGLTDSDATDSVSLENILELITLEKSAQYSQEELKKAGHQFENLVVDCRWMGIKCNNGYFRKYWRNSWNWKYGNCYTFNFGLANDNSTLSSLRTNNAGPKYGLTLDLFIEQHDYIRELSEEAGVKVVIVDGKQHPFPFQEGVTVSPGVATVIALRKEVIERVDRFNNKSCIDDTENVQSIYNDDGSVIYTIQGCLDTCLVEHQINECNCSDARYAKDGSVCSNRVQSECLANVEMKYKKDEYGCIRRCPQGCKSISYRKTISEAQLSKQYTETQRTVLNKTSKFQKYVKTKDDFAKDFLRIKIFFEELNLIRIHQEFSYPVSNLLSDIGGQLGLWVGLSLITFAEVGDLFISLLMLAFSKD